MLLLMLGVACCAPQAATQYDAGTAGLPHTSLVGTTAAAGNGPVVLSSGRGQTPRSTAQGFTQYGTGPTTGTADTQPVALAGAAAGDGVTLEFVNADVKDVARSVLGDLLGLPYSVDPGLAAQVTIETSRPIPRGAVLPALESALRTSGIGLVQVGGVWRVVALASAARGAPPLGRNATAGFGTSIIPLRWVSATELSRTLEPLAPQGVTIVADAGRNVLIISGSPQDLADLQGQINSFDVDAMRGQSIALIPLRNASARAVASELNRALASDGGPGAGMVRIIALDRMNAILATTPQPAYLNRIKDWAARLDQGGDGPDRRIYVYRIQNGRASDIAGVLSKVLGNTASVTTADISSNGNGNIPTVNATTETLTSGGTSGVTGAGAGMGGGAPAAATGQAPIGTGAGSAMLTDIQRSIINDPGQSDRMRVTADIANNALLVYANSQEWSFVQSTLAQLDIQPLQVMIEASIAEVTLTGELKYGLQYFFQSGKWGGSLTSTLAGAAAQLFPGFNLVYAGNISSILTMLESLTQVRVLSSPNLLVLNNQTARLQVGDQVPIATQSAVSTIGGNSPIVNSIDYRDTGVILRITPRVNANGLVLLDISQEVSDVVPNSSTTPNAPTPTIQQRRVTSSVAVHDGETIAIGGMIQDRRTDGKVGIPLLMDVPYLGALFSTTDRTTRRTELIVLITPHVARNRDEMRTLTSDLRATMPLLATPPTQRARR